MKTDTYKGWTHTSRLTVEHGKLARYSIGFHRRQGDWYDEIRYDSHERKKGRWVDMPHFHLKLQSALKGDEDKAVEELKEIKNTYVTAIGEVLDK